jgi:AraC-like DNA-binding protein
MARASDDDMTGSALVKLMEASFRRQRLNLPRLKIRKDGAHASLTDKVTVAETVLRLYGPGPLLNVGASISEMARDPLGAALLCAPSGRSLFDRWQRLERYVHTRHPIVMFDVTDSTARLDHQGDLDDPPSVAINFVLAGLFAHLLLAIGCQHVKLAIGHKKQAVPIELDLFNGCAAQINSRDTGLWHYDWKEAPQHSMLPRLDATASNKAGRQLSGQLYEFIKHDLLHIWSLAQAAAILAVSQRTLQRRLSDEGLTLTALRRRAQIESASRHLLSERVSLSAIGYVCGFSDLPHFTRVFRKHVGMPPSAFRALQETLPRK